jgi:hypothetical protein
MRDAINNNPKVQLGLLGALVLVVGLMFAPQFLTHKSGDSASSASTSAPASTPPPTAGATTAGATAAPSTAPPVAAATTVSPDALIPGPGLPRPVIAAWNRGETVVLLVVRQGGIDDRLVRGSVQSLSGESAVAVFVTRAKGIARYSRITQGVGVSQVPALVVVRPRKVSGSVPQAQVTYGFRDAQGVVQAVHDAVYSGKDDLPYSPR